MKKTHMIASFVACGSLFLSGIALSASKSDRTAVREKRQKTTVAKSAARSKAKSSSIAQYSPKGASSKASKIEQKKPAKQIEILAEPADPEVGLSGSLTGEQINWQAITSGGGFSSSLNFGLLSAIGQPAAGPSSSTNFNLNSGFVQNFGGGCCVNAGDANNDTKTNIADVTFLIARIFAGGPAPPCCEQGDANGDAKVNIADVTFLIARIFAGGPAPICGPAGLTC